MTNLFDLARPLLYCFDAEQAHAMTLRALQAGQSFLRATQQITDDPRTVMGLRFPNPIGLAAGADKNGDAIDGFGAMGFGFIEVGGVTPRAQEGNPKPRLFRLPEQQAIINRMGFNNFGIDYLAEKLLQHQRYGKWKGVLAVNLGKNKDTPLENAADDYALCYQRVYTLCDYATINISSPNTANLRELQSAEWLSPLLARMKNEQKKLADQHGKYVPLAVKVAPDLSAEAIDTIAEQLLAQQMDALVATNTTLSRAGVEHAAQGSESGGLSGAPLHQRSTEIIAQFAKRLQGALPIIGVGGITQGTHAKEKMQAGASLVQVYSGLVYRGPTLVKEMAHALRAT